MNYSIDGFTFAEVRDQILIDTEGQNHGFFETTLGELVGSYEGGVDIAGAEREYVLTHNGFNQFWTRLGFPVAAVNKLSTELQQQVALEMAGEVPDTPLKVATSNGEIDAVLSGEYEPISNATLAIMLSTLLPEKSTVHRWNLHNRSLDLRIVAPEWGVELSNNGASDPGWGGLHIYNNEIGSGAFTMKMVLARVACFNFVVSEHEVVRQQHRWHSPAELHASITEGIKQVPSFAGQIADDLRGWRETPVEHPTIAFTKVGERGGIPQYAMQDAQEWWKQDGEQHNLFAVMQAISYGVKRITDSPRGRPSWDRRNQLESLVMQVGNHVQEHGEEAWHECPACHQAVEVE